MKRIGKILEKSLLVGCGFGHIDAQRLVRAVIENDEPVLTRNPFVGAVDLVRQLLQPLFIGRPPIERANNLVGSRMLRRQEKAQADLLFPRKVDRALDISEHRAGPGQVECEFSARSVESDGLHSVCLPYRVCPLLPQRGWIRPSASIAWRGGRHAKREGQRYSRGLRFDRAPDRLDRAKPSQRMQRAALDAFSSCESG